MPNVEVYKESELTDSQIESIATLTNSIWPKEGITLEQKIEQLKAKARSPERAKVNPVRFVVWDGEEAIAHSLVFDRQIHLLDNRDQIVQSINVVALAGVCSDASHRGKGLGLAVVKMAFEQINAQRPVSLFQTGVPKFYEKLGGRVVDNQFVNLLDTDDPQANPWWDERAMIVPGKFDWPSDWPNWPNWPNEKIDLNGAGY